MIIMAADRLGKSEAQEVLGNSSGMILNEKESFISIGYVDYCVEALGDRDYECFYELDGANSALLKAALAKSYTGDLFDMCTKAFTIKFSNSRFENFCADNGIAYTKKTY